MNRNELFNNELERLHNIIDSNVNELFKRWARDRIEVVQSGMLHFVYEESLPELPEAPKCVND